MLKIITLSGWCSRNALKGHNILGWGNALSLWGIGKTYPTNPAVITHIISLWAIIKMPQSLSKICTHIVFSTKYRQPLIDDKIEAELHRYLGGICKKFDCLPIKVGGYVDHIHILCVLSRKIAVMKLLEEVKKSSSKWIKTQGSDYANFYWQDGYGIFSVNPYELDVVIKYIENQKMHHENKTFQTEYRGFLKKYNVEYDERYVWE